MAVFLRRDPALYSETRESLGISHAAAVAERGSPGVSVDKEKRPEKAFFCLRYGMGANLCPNQDKKTCAYLRSCPFCGASSVATPLVTCAGTWLAYGHPWWWCQSPVEQVTERKQPRVPGAVRAEVDDFVNLEGLLQEVRLLLQGLPGLESLRRAKSWGTGKLQSRDSAVALARLRQGDDAALTPRLKVVPLLCTACLSL